MRLGHPHSFVLLVPAQLSLSFFSRLTTYLTPSLFYSVLMAFVPSVKGMYALRFFIGVFEASSYPGIITILCSWYTPAELATRIAIFGTSYPAANIFVSFMQAALHKGMEGKSGLAGWKVRRLDPTFRAKVSSVGRWGANRPT